jgi:hypothetical protein
MQLRPMSQEIETGTETAFCVENKNAFNFHQSEQLRIDCHK